MRPFIDQSFHLDFLLCVNYLSHTEIAFFDSFIVQKVFCCIFQYELTDFQNISAIGNLQGSFGILLDQQNWQTVLFNLLDCAENFFNQQWCKGCGVCAAFCPSRALSLDSGGKAVWEPSLCTGCRLCELYCPDLGVECLRDDTETIREGV